MACENGYFEYKGECYRSPPSVIGYKYTTDGYNTRHNICHNKASNFMYKTMPGTDKYGQCQDDAKTNQGAYFCNGSRNNCWEKCELEGGCPTGYRFQFPIKHHSKKDGLDQWTSPTAEPKYCSLTPGEGDHCKYCQTFQGDKFLC